jgi:hypothetical protein
MVKETRLGTKRSPGSSLFQRASLRCARACGARKSLYSLLTRHLFLIPARRDSEAYRAISSRPAKAGLEHRGLKFVLFLD